VSDWWLAPTPECPLIAVDRSRGGEKDVTSSTGVKVVNRVVYNFMSPPVTAREQDVGADRDPEGEIADNRYLDEHAKDRKDRQYKRHDNRTVHCTYLLALRRNAKIRAGRRETPRSTNCNPNWRVAEWDHSSMSCVLIPR
jgi:hypothetical protein